MKTLLILCGGIEAKQAVTIAKSMGLHVIVCDGNINAPAREIADDFIHASIYHPNDILTAIKNYPLKDSIDGVITVAADNPLSVCKVANYLGLKSLSEETADISTNKLKMKNILRKFNVALPWYKEISSLENLEDVISSRPSEYVLKPIDSRGSRGVIRINDSSQYKKAFEYSMSNTNSKKLILEEWVTGDQLSSESLVFNKRAYLCGLSDRNYGRLQELYPYVVEDGGDTPSKHSSYELQDRINRLMSNICESVNLVEGSIKGDLILSNDKLYLIEFAARLSGGFFSTHIIPQVYDYNLIENTIRIALDEKPLLPKYPLVNKKYQAGRFVFLPKGTVKRISNLPKKNKKIIYFSLNIKEGDYIENITNHTMRAGGVITVCSSPNEASRLAEKVISDLDIEIE